LSVGLCAGPVTLLAQRGQALLATNVDGTPNNPNHPWLRRHAAKTCDVIQMQRRRVCFSVFDNEASAGFIKDFFSPLSPNRQRTPGSPTGTSLNPMRTAIGLRPAIVSRHPQMMLAIGKSWHCVAAAK